MENGPIPATRCFFLTLLVAAIPTGAADGPGDDDPRTQPIHECILEATLDLYNAIKSEPATNVLADPEGYAARNRDHAEHYLAELLECSAVYDYVLCPKPNLVDWAKPYVNDNYIARGDVETGVPVLIPTAATITQHLVVVVSTQSRAIAEC